MNLPKLETPRYNLIVPSSGKNVEYRPFLVKEEKILLLAQESNNNKTMMKAMGDIIESCTFNELKLKELTSFDLEYVFLKLRSKSVGEVADLLFACKECEVKNDVSVNLDEIELKFDKKKKIKKIMLTDTVGVIPKYIGAEDVIKLTELENKQDKLISETLIASIESIFDEETVYPLEDANMKEINDFVNQLNRKQLEELQKFIADAPRLKHNIEFKCVGCGEMNNIELEGLQSFFE